MWMTGDIFKTVYFVVRHLPIQFWLCGILQISIDNAILFQVYYYSPAKSAWGRCPSTDVLESVWREASVHDCGIVCLETSLCPWLSQSSEDRSLHGWTRLCWRQAFAHGWVADLCSQHTSAHGCEVYAWRRHLRELHVTALAYSCYIQSVWNYFYIQVYI